LLSLSPQRFTSVSYYEGKNSPLAANEARHRMSGNHVNLKFEHRAMPLIGALGR
jgi:hypothetical protein